MNKLLSEQEMLWDELSNSFDSAAILKFKQILILFFNVDTTLKFKDPNHPARCLTIHQYPYDNHIRTIVFHLRRTLWSIEMKSALRAIRRHIFDGTTRANTILMNAIEIMYEMISMSCDWGWN
jgi:hypothetical protein